MVRQHGARHDKNNRGQILAALALREQATAKQIAADLGWKQTLASKYLGLLHNEGKVDRERAGQAPQSWEYIYRIKPPVVESPPSQWRPELRIASPLRDGAVAMLDEMEDVG